MNSIIVAIKGRYDDANADNTTGKNYLKKNRMYICWTPISTEFTYLSGVLRPLSIKGHTHTRQLLCGFIAHLVEHCNGNTKVVGLNPVQSLKLLLFH